MYTVQLLNISTIIDQKNYCIYWFNDVGACCHTLSGNENLLYIDSDL